MINFEQFCNITNRTYCEFPYWLLIRVNICIQHKLLEVNCNQTKIGPNGPELIWHFGT